MFLGIDGISLTVLILKLVCVGSSFEFQIEPDRVGVMGLYDGESGDGGKKRPYRILTWGWLDSLHNLSWKYGRMILVWKYRDGVWVVPLTPDHKVDGSVDIDLVFRYQVAMTGERSNKTWEAITSSVRI